MKSPSRLRFANCSQQGPWFHLTTVDSQHNRLVPRHTHDYDEIAWLDAGSCRHWCNGREDTLTSGDLLLMRAGDVHQMSECGRSFRFTNLSLAPELSRELRRAHADEWRFLHSSDQPCRVHLSTAALAEVSSEATRLAGVPHTRLVVEHLVLGIWLRCLRQRSVVADTSAPEWLQQALLRIEEPEIAAQGVPGLIAVAGRSAEHVSRECRRWLDQTPSQLVNAARLRHAALQLRMTSRSVVAIAAECGFDDPGRFFRLFKKAHATTPAAYRRQ